MIKFMMRWCSWERQITERVGSFTLLLLCAEASLTHAAWCCSVLCNPCLFEKLTVYHHMPRLLTCWLFPRLSRVRSGDEELREFVTGQWFKDCQLDSSWFTIASVRVVRGDINISVTLPHGHWLPLIGLKWSRDLDIGFWLAESEHVTWILASGWLPWSLVTVGSSLQRRYTVSCPLGWRGWPSLHKRLVTSQQQERIIKAWSNLPVGTSDSLHELSCIAAST